MIDTWEKKSLLNGVILHFGAISQLKMVYEEMGELLQALNKLDRATSSDENFGTQPKEHHSIKYCLAYWNTCSEIADLSIMLDQLKIIFSSEGVQISEERKLERLKDRFIKYCEKNNIQYKIEVDPYADLPF